jgi:D-alanine transaminase
LSICFLNGDFLPLDEARVSVLDRGFLLGDGVYEVIPVYNGKLFRGEDHLARLQASLDAIQMDNPLLPDQWLSLLRKLIERNGNGFLSLYLQVTRGVAMRDHAFPADTSPTVFAMCNPLKLVPAEVLQNGVAAVTLSDNRWLRCNIKAISLLPNVLLRQTAVEKDVSEALLIRDGQVTEGAASNVFLVKDGVVKTPPKSSFILAGITRDVVLELVHAGPYAAEETSIAEAELLEADEIWLSSSSKELLPVTRLNGKIVGDGKPGPAWSQTHDQFQHMKQQF